MPFRPVQPDKLSAAVIRQIEQLILRGILRPGERLPPERELSERMGVSRPSLRDAVGALQETGLLTAKPGAGVYVADVLGSAFAPALTELFARHDEAVFDYLSFRRPILVWGPEYCSAVRVATEFDSAECVTDSDLFLKTPTLQGLSPMRHRRCTIFAVSPLPPRARRLPPPSRLRSALRAGRNAGWPGR